MSFLSRLATLSLCLLGTSVSTLAYEKTQHGFRVNIGETHIELAAEQPGIFRASISYDGIPQPAPSVFLSGTQSGSGQGSIPDHPKAGAPGIVLQPSTEAWELISVGRQVGLKTRSGQLLIDTETGQWSFMDGQGKALITQGSLAQLQHDATSPHDTVTIDITMSRERQLKLYGCGNDTRDLLKLEGNSHMANGIAVIPYYWSNTGYSAFGVTSDDDSPARWKTSRPGTVTWSFLGRRADLYLLVAPDLHQAAQRYADLTGHPKVSPLWAFGYLQSRWGWTDPAYIEDTLKTFRAKKLPVDAFIFDFECYTRTPDYELKPEGQPDFTDFRWNPMLFPQPARQIADELEQGVHIIPIRKPRIGNSATLRMMRDKGWILATGKNGEKGELMDSRDINFENPEVRDWYGEQSRTMIDDGVAGWWNDEGESVYTKYYYWNLAEFDALAKFKPGQRHWSINRAFQPGMERLGASAWTGDITTSWETLAGVPADLLNWSLAGMPYGGCDIGGFTGSPSPEMLTRWMQVGVFLPVMRSHSVNTVEPHFPWLYGQAAEDAMRAALNLRYRLIPFYYSLAHETYETGVPYMRPMVMEFPEDPQVENMTDQWMLGTGLMAAPLLTEGGKRSIYFPAGTWYKFDTNEVQPGGLTINLDARLDALPAYVRAGTILPLSQVIPSTAQLPGGPLEVQIYPGRDADFTLVEDDGFTYDYVNGNIRKTVFHWDESAQTLNWEQTGPYAGPHTFKTLHVTVFAPAGQKQATAKFYASATLKLK